MSPPGTLVIGHPVPPIDERLSERFTLYPWTSPAERDAARAAASTIKAIVGDGRAQVDGALLDQFPQVGLVAKFGVGYESIDVAAARERGVVVTNTPDVLNEEVADLTVGLLLATIRRIPQADRFLRAGDWAGGRFPLSPSLRGRRIGIVGLGRIGKAVAARLAGFNVAILYHGRSPQPAVPYRYCATLLDLARQADVLIVVAPGGGETRGMIGAEVLRALGPDGILINVSRGSLVDEAALIAALRDGTILAAGLDVFEKEPQVPAALTAMDNVVLLPHIGSGSAHTFGLMAQLVVDNLFAWFDGKPPPTPVPETPVPKRA